MLISVRMALDGLQEQATSVKAAEARLTRERAIRDNMIREALGSGVTYREVGRRTGLTRERLNTIASKPDIDVTET